MTPETRPMTWLIVPFVVMIVFAAAGGFFVGRTQAMFERAEETDTRAPTETNRAEEAESGASPDTADTTATADAHAETTTDGKAMPPDPLEPPDVPRTAPGMANRLGDRYWYLPYAVTNERQGLAFVDAYREALKDEGPPPDELSVPSGRGAGGRDTLYRNRSGVSNLFIEDINEPEDSAVASSDIPLLIAQPLPGAQGSSVLYLDGHVEFVPWGEFPITERFINALSKLDPPERV